MISAPRALHPIALRLGRCMIPSLALLAAASAAREDKDSDDGRGNGKQRPKPAWEPLAVVQPPDRILSHAPTFNRHQKITFPFETQTNTSKKKTSWDRESLAGHPMPCASSSRYSVGHDPIGKGSFGMVYRATDRYTGEVLAVKSVAKEFSKDASFRREKDALLRVRRRGGHPHICGLRDTIDESERYLMVLEFVGGGEMFDRLIERGSYSERDASRLVRQLAEGLDFLHSIGIVHGDLKTENLMLSSDQGDAVVKIVDFGSAEVASESNDDTKAAETRKSLPIGGTEVNLANSAHSANRNHADSRSYGRTTPAYSPPELLDSAARGTADEFPILPSLDMWSLGVILHIMLTGRHPFDLSGDSSDDEVIDNIRHRRSLNLDPDLPHLSHLSPAAIDLMRNLTAERQEKRLTAHELLVHPWVTGRPPRRVAEVKTMTSVPLT